MRLWHPDGEIGKKGVKIVVASVLEVESDTNKSSIL